MTATCIAATALRLEEITEHGPYYIGTYPRREALRRRAAEAYARGINPKQIRVTPVEEQR